MSVMHNAFSVRSSIRCIRLAAVFVVGALVVSACTADEVTAPDLVLKHRAAEYRCVRPATGYAAGDTLMPDENNLCLPGYDNVPWY